VDHALVAIIGAAVGGIAATANNLIGVRAKARTDVEQKRQEMFRTACADYSAALVSTRSLSWTLKELVREGHSGSTEATEVRAQIRTAREQSQVGYERVRMLSESVETQLAARYCLCHGTPSGRRPKHPPTRVPQIIQANPRVIGSTRP
jgi:hypothetical protein